MTEFLSPLRLELMQRRFDRMKQNDALMAYRREKAKNQPGQHPESVKSQSIVKEIKALEMSSATAKARQQALDAFAKSPADDFARGVRESAQRIASAAPDPGKEGRYLIIESRSDGNLLMLINEIQGDTVYATAVNGDGGKLEGSPLVPINVAKARRSVTMFASLPDAIAYAQMSNIKLASV